MQQNYFYFIYRNNTLPTSILILKSGLKGLIFKKIEHNGFHNSIYC